MYSLYEENNQPQGEQVNKTVSNIVVIVFENYYTNFEKKLQTVEDSSKKEKIVQALRYFTKDIVLSSIQYSDRKTINMSENIGDELGELIKLYVEHVVGKQHGIYDKPVNGLFFQNYNGYDEDFEFLQTIVSDENVDFRVLINRYVIDNYSKIGKTIASMIRIPLETTNPTPEQQQVRTSVVEELKKNPVGKYALEFAKEQVTSLANDLRYDIRNTVNGYVKERVIYRAFDFALNGVTSGLKSVGGMVGSLFKKGFSLLKRKKGLYNLYKYGYVTENKDNQGGKKSFLRMLWDMFKQLFEYFFVKKKTLGFAILGGIVLAVVVSGLEILYKPFGFIFKLIKKVFLLPFKVLLSFFRSNKAEELIEEIIYDKKKRKIYNDKVKKILFLSYLYSEI